MRRQPRCIRWWYGPVPRWSPAGSGCHTSRRWLASPLRGKGHWTTDQERAADDVLDAVGIDAQVGAVCSRHLHCGVRGDDDGYHRGDQDVSSDGDGAGPQTSSLVSVPLMAEPLDRLAGAAFAVVGCRHVKAHIMLPGTINAKTAASISLAAFAFISNLLWQI